MREGNTTMLGTISVRGCGEADAIPDRGYLWLELTNVEPTKQAARAKVARRSRKLTKVLDELNIPKEARHTAHLSVDEEREYVKTKWVHKGFRARLLVTISLTDTSLMGAVSTAAVDQTDASVSGPSWHVNRDNIAHTEARKGAIVDSRRRADAYAEALGVKIAGMLDVTEPGLKRRVELQEQSDVAYSMAPRASSQDSLDIEIDPGELDISARVEVVYAVEQ